MVFLHGINVLETSKIHIQPSVKISLKVFEFYIVEFISFFGKHSLNCRISYNDNIFFSSLPSYEIFPDVVNL